jgi:hypothetical protein
MVDLQAEENEALASLIVGAAVIQRWLPSPWLFWTQKYNIEKKLDSVYVNATISSS